MPGDLQLEDENMFSRTVGVVSQPSGLVRLVLATGIVSTEKKAEQLLLWTAGVCLVATAVISFVFLPGSKPPVNPYQEGQSVLIYPGGTSSK